MRPMVAKVPTKIATIIQAKRLRSAPSAGPAAICQMLVAIAGSTISAAACAGGMTMLRSPITTVGRPTPTAPLMKPATRNATAMKTSGAAPSVNFGPLLRRHHPGGRVDADHLAVRPVIEHEGDLRLRGIGRFHEARGIHIA